MLWLSTSGRTANSTSSDGVRRRGRRRSASRPACPAGVRGSPRRTPRRGPCRRRRGRRGRPSSARRGRGPCGRSPRRRARARRPPAPRGLRVSTRQNPHARVQRSPSTMNVAVPSAQHSDRFGQPASSHTVTRPRSRIGLLQRQHLRPVVHLRPQPLRLAGLDRQPRRHAGRGEPRRQPHRLAGTGATGEQRQVVDAGAATRRPGARPRRCPTARRRAGRRRRRRRASARRRPPRRATSPGGRRCRTPRCARAGSVMSVATLRAKPCIVRPRLRRTPMAQILRGFGPSASTHTPGYSVEPAGRDAERRQRVDDELLDVAHVLRRRRGGWRRRRSGSRRAGRGRGT